jgi:hypothetical protein
MSSVATGHDTWLSGGIYLRTTIESAAITEQLDRSLGD